MTAFSMLCHSEKQIEIYPGKMRFNVTSRDIPQKKRTEEYFQDLVLKNCRKIYMCKWPPLMAYLH